ncbi:MULTISPECIES: DUF624 domain-containing protein [unclassified Jeotgalibaca]|uniref:DUF624 domain-containing protein n=1 Tax=unclassified Jeotgalibaca TaxID=2621505 RepID=UPI003FD141E3
MLIRRIMPIFQWFSKYVLLSLLIVLGIVLGLGVLGLFPSLYAASSVCQEWRTRSDLPVIRYYWQAYKTKFWSSQKYGYFALFITLVVASNVLYWNQLAVPFAAVGKYTWFFLLLLVSISNAMILPTAITNQFDVRETLQLFALSLKNPIRHIVILFGLVLLYIALVFLPGIMLFLIWGLMVHWINYHSEFS